MAKFIYNMQNLLDIKLKLEEQKKVAFGTAKAKLDEEEERLHYFFRKKSDYQFKLKECMSGKISLLEANHTEQAIRVMDTKIEQQTIVVHQAKRQVEIARAQLNEAIKERKTHEKLKEHAFEEFKRELIATEGKEVDELVSFKYGRNKGCE